MQVDLYCGDAATVMLEMPERSVDVVVTSPPYNLGIKYADGVRDDMSREAYLGVFTPSWVRRVRRVLSDDGHFFLNVGGSPTNPMLPFEILAPILAEGFVLQNTFHWIKSLTFEDKHGNPVSQGHYKPINSSRFVNDCHEYVFHFSPSGKSPLSRLAIGVPFQDKSNIGRRGHAADVRCRGNIWVLPYETIRSSEKQRPHPATFPTKLAEQCIMIAGTPPVVLDPFVGSGNTLRAAMNCGCARGIGIDLSQSYIGGCRDRFGLTTTPRADSVGDG